MSEPRIGVYVCQCGINIASTVDVESVKDFAAGLPHVVIAREGRYTCSEAEQVGIQDDIKNYDLDRVVVASCTPRMHEPTFQRLLTASGLNPYFFEMANIREHVSWVIDDPVAATDKAKRLVRSAVQRVAYHVALEPRQEPVTQAAMVVGGGIAGIQSALSIAEAGYKVYLVEKEPSIGGHMAKLDKTFPTLDCSIWILGPKMMDVGRHPNIELLDYSEVVDVQGYVGNFEVKVRRKARYVHTDLCTGCGLCDEACVLRGGKGRLMVPHEFDEGMGKRPAAYIPFAQAVPLKAIIDPRACLWLAKGKCSKKCCDVCGPDAIDFEMEESFVDLKVGSIIVATGFSMWDATQLPDYGYGKSPNILTSLEFERLSNASGPTAGEIYTAEGKKPERVAIVHCVGSRDERAHSYCSRFCCMYSLKQAHQLKEKLGGEVFSIYMDMRTFGKDYEEFYRRNRDEGIQFIQGRPSQITVDQVTGELFVEVEDILLGRVVELNVDMVILATAIEPPPDAGELASLFGLGRTPDGWFAEAHPKLRPVETATAGVFLAGCAQGPRDVPDTVAHAGAAAAEAVGLLNRGQVTISPTVAVVNADKCVGCGECIPTCPYTAIWRNVSDKAEINPALCQGCGTCVATCPSGAITALHFTDQEIVAQIDGLLELVL